MGFGSQDYWIGKPIFPEELRSVPLMSRKSLVLRAINGTGIPNQIERPHSADADFTSAVARRMEAAAIGTVEAVLLECAGMDIQSRIEDLFDE